MFIFAFVEIQFPPVNIQTRTLTSFAEIVPKTPVARSRGGERVVDIKTTGTFRQTPRDVCVPLYPKPMRRRNQRCSQTHPIKLRQSHRLGRWVCVVILTASEKSQTPVVRTVFHHVDARCLVPNSRETRPPDVRIALESCLGQVYRAIANVYSWVCRVDACVVGWIGVRGRRS